MLPSQNKFILCILYMITHVILKKKCQCKTINIVNNTGYLGLEMCSSMKWEEQIFSVSNNIRKMIYMIKELRDIFKEKKLRLIYLALLEPIISYGIIG